MANVHFFLQGKGGVGKSFSSTMMAQYVLSSTGTPPVCIDTDPVNNTFSAYKAFDATWLDIREGDGVNPKKFDIIMNRIAALAEADSLIVDNGASTFIAFSNYVITNGVTDIITEALGHTMYVHTLVIGGDGMMDTLNGFTALAQQLPPSVRVVVWLNPFFGPIVADGKTFEEFSAYRKNQDKVFALVRLPELQRETFGANLMDMMKRRMTFDEALTDASYEIMDRQRLKIARQKIFAAISACPEI